MQQSHSALVRLHLSLIAGSYSILILNVAHQYQYCIKTVAIAVNYVMQLIVHRIPHGKVRKQH